MNPPPLSGVSARHWLVVVGSGLLMALNVLMFLSVGLLLPPMAATLGAGLGQVALYVSISMAASALMLTLAGPRLLVRLGARKLSIIGGLLTGSALVLTAHVTSLTQLYVLAVAAGLMSAVSMQMTWSAMINDWFVARRGLMQGLVMAVASLGGILAGAVLPKVVLSNGWQGGYVFSGATCVLLTVVAGFMIRSRPAEVGLEPFGMDLVVEPEDGENPPADAIELASGPTGGVAARSPQFIALLVGLTIYTAIMAMQQHYPSIAAERGLSLAAAGSLLSLLSVATVVATLLVGAMSDRWGPWVTYLVLGGLLIVALTVIGFSVGYPRQAVGLLLLALPAVCPPILTPTLLRHTFGERAFVPLLGVTTATMPVGIAIGSPLWGVLKDATGSYDLALKISTGLVLVIVGLVSFALITGGRRWGADHEQAPVSAPAADLSSDRG